MSGIAQFATEEVVKDKGYYKDQTRKAQWALGKSMTLNVILTIALICFFMADNTKYFAVTKDYRVVPLTPLNQPTVSDAELGIWVNKVVAQSLSIDFLAYKQQLNAVRPYYTDQGFHDFVVAFKESGNLHMIINRKLRAMATPSSPPLIKDKMLIDGRLTWLLEVPFIVMHESATESLKIERFVTVRVVRVEDPNADKLLKINQIVVGGR